MPGTYLSAAWVNPNTTEPKYLANRVELRGRMLGVFEDYLQQWRREPSEGLRDARILVTGDRGIGKSILTRAVVADLAEKHDQTVIPVHVDSRNLHLRQALVQLARDVEAQLRPLAEQHREELLPLLDHLRLLTQGDRISRDKHSAIATKYGSTAKVGVERVVKLGGQFSWEQTRQHSSGRTVEAEVTEAVLRSALKALLKFMAEREHPWMVVVYYDNLDQLLALRDADDILSSTRLILEVGPCLAVAHIRSEAFVDNLGRDFTEKFEVDPLGQAELLEVLDRRLLTAPPEVRAALGAGGHGREVVERLADCTGNALTFLRWLLALQRRVPAPFPADWHGDATLGQIARHALPGQAPDLELLQRLGRIVDGAATRWFSRQHLSGGGTETLSDDEIEQLVRLQVLLPRFRFEDAGDLLMQPTLDLLRPSVMAGLRS